MESEILKPKKTRGETFVEYVIKRLPGDSAFSAKLRRADNPATEYQVWEHLVQWCDLDKPWERIPFATVVAALARAKPRKEGHVGIGRAVATCYDRGAESDAAKAKLRRLLACDTAEEVCRILRSTLRLIQSRGVAIHYGHLLDELLWFGEKQKIRWATDFYGRRADHDSDNA